MQSTVKTVSEYMSGLPEDRQKMLQELRNTVKKNLPAGFVEMMYAGMIAYQVPIEKYPDTYNREPLLYVGISNQKGYVSLYLMSLYIIPKFRDKFILNAKKEVKKLDMAASCIRFKKYEEVPFEAIADAVGRVTLRQFVTSAKKAHSKEVVERPEKKEV